MNSSFHLLIKLKQQIKIELIKGTLSFERDARERLDWFLKENNSYNFAKLIDEFEKNNKNDFVELLFAYEDLRNLQIPKVN